MERDQDVVLAKIEQKVKNMKNGVLMEM